MIKKIGIIGVGHFASYLVEGFCAATGKTEITLSPRGKEMSLSLANKFNCKIATDNQDVIDRSDVIILSIKPNDLNDALNDLHFNKDKLVISVVAGAHLEAVNSLVSPATAVCALPVSCAAINKSPSLLYPDQEIAREILSLLGQVIVCSSQKEYDTAGAYSAFYGWNFKLIEEMSRWGEANGLPCETARIISEQMISGAAGMAAKDNDKNLQDIVSNIATKGGITELGLNTIDSQDGFKSWHDAMDAVRNRLSNK